MNFSFNAALRNASFRNYHVINGIAFMISKRGIAGRVIIFERIGGFLNPRFSVKCADFKESLNLNPYTFAYLDPPYPEVTGAYGDSAEFHEEFPHQELAEMLYRRKSSWMLSYNNCDTVKSLYPPSDFRYDYPKIAHRSNHGFGEDSNEVLIRPKGQPPCS